MVVHTFVHLIEEKDIRVAGFSVLLISPLMTKVRSGHHGPVDLLSLDAFI